MQPGMTAASVVGLGWPVVADRGPAVRLRALLLNALLATGAAVWAVRVMDPARPSALEAPSLGLAVALLAAAWAMDATRVDWGSDRAGRVQAATATNAVLLPAAILLPPALFLLVASSSALVFLTGPRGWTGVLGNASIRVATVSIAAGLYSLLAPGWPPTPQDAASVSALTLAGLSMVLTEALLVVNLVRAWGGLDARDLPLLDPRGLAIEVPEILLGAVLCLLFPTPATLLVIGLVVWIHLTVRAYARLRSASRDPKTGLLSWPGFEQLAAAELQRAERMHHPAALLLMDLDGLKRVNTTHGHLAGDQWIAATAEILSRSVRGYDLLARFGGDEFALLLPETGLRAAATTAERIRRTVAATRVPGVEAAVGISIGVAAAEPGQDVRALVAQADQALRRAKAEQRNQVVTAG